jgi:hypothetical protein
MPIPFFNAGEYVLMTPFSGVSPASGTLTALVNKAHAYVASADALVRAHVSYADAAHLSRLRAE